MLASRRAFPALSRVLVPASEKSALVNLVAQFPELGAAQYVECRLGRPEQPGKVDLLVSATKFQRAGLAQHAWAGKLPGAGLAAFRRLLIEWNRPESRLFESVPIAWVEFDDVVRQRAACANVAVCVVPSYLDPFAPLTSHAGPSLVELLADCVALLQGRSCRSEERTVLERCVQCLPSGAHWIQLSVMTCREPMQLKLYGVLPQHSVLEYLADVGWPGNTTAIAASLRNYCSAEKTGDLVYLDLPVSELLEPAGLGLGVCFAQQQLRSALENDPQRRALLARLCNEGLCSAEESQALAEWPCELNLTCEGVATSLQRWLDIKLVHGGDGTRQAKAYLGFAERAPKGSVSL